MGDKFQKQKLRLQKNTDLYTFNIQSLYFWYKMELWQFRYLKSLSNEVEDDEAAVTHYNRNKIDSEIYREKMSTLVLVVFFQFCNISEKKNPIRFTPSKLWLYVFVSLFFHVK